jgi:hypothetical protein
MEATDLVVQASVTTILAGQHSMAQHSTVQIGESGQHLQHQQQDLAAICRRLQTGLAQC